MAEQHPKTKLTKAEAGRLGGLRTQQRHGTEHFQQAGRKGGAATLAAHGVEHMAAIGRKGFARLAGRIGCHRKRKAAVQLLQAMGRLATPPRPVMRDDVYEPHGPEDPEEENPVVAHVLASIRSAPIPPDGGL
jgi:general stress protein YciG